LAEYVELLIEAGANFSTEINVNDVNGDPLDLSDYVVRSQMRKSYYSENSIEFDIDIAYPLEGTVIMSLQPSITANIRAGRYVYDVELEDQDGNVTRIFEGIITVLPNVTR
jgi:hypothetical protein